MHARAEGREHAQPPIADLVPEALDDDGAIGREDAGCELLLAQVLDERPGGALVAGVQARQALHGALVVERRELALQAAHGASELERATRLLALPEGHLGRLPGRGGDDHAVRAISSMRHAEAPSRKTWPSRASCTISSSSSPTRPPPSARKTP